ncbi:MULTISPECIES: M48 family metallopeptidase [Acinetobacter]|uniref:M48 family peptidase n=2 Tax=Acinetobacter TaxID=469 RepID=A0A4Q7B438_9GAMM|nr:MULTISPECIES: M48 family metallopeptidase [Acinetobacter]MCW8040292.1 M48 family metallopeptidase [Acinetobacter entericus]RZG69437.1 M48 family peptidase [Acinetobacter bouvetii]TCB70236.1 M48 family peptidase [Acinetobacter sp. ANC 4177]
MGTAGADRKQFMVIPEKAWNVQSERSYTRFVNRAKDQQVLVIDAKLNQLMEQLRTEADAFRTGSEQWKWDIKGNLNGELNAHSLPGGKIIVNTGLYWGLKLNQDELAFVVAHEMAHSLRDHNREKASMLLASNLAILTATAGAGAIASAAASVTSQVALIPKGWNLEVEADVIGLDIMSRAGYNPKAAVDFWAKFQNESNRRKAFDIKPLMNDALYAKRIGNIEKYLPEMQARYKQVLATKVHSSQYAARNMAQ